MDTIDAFAVDRELKRCAERWVAYRRALGRGEQNVGDPFGPSRWVCGRATFNQLAELRGDPVAPALMRWVFRFTTERVNSAVVAGIAEQRRRVVHAVPQPTQGRFSIDQMLKRALADDRERPYWLQQFLRHAEATQHGVVQLWERRQEIASQMALASPDVIEAPAEALYDLAQTWLDMSADLWQTRATLELDELVTQGLALESNLEFPAHLNPRSVLGFFSDTKLFEGLDLNPGRLPAAYAPASFLRAFARLGAAFLDASAPRDQPFAIAHDAFGLSRRQHGALFAQLLIEPEFLRRRLGASKEAAQHARRQLGTSLLIESRLAALRVLLRRAAHQGGRALRETFETVCPSAIRVPLPVACAGVLVRLHEDDLQRFVGLFMAAETMRSLTQAHDEDWFRNPRGVDQLRSEAELPPPCRAEQRDIEAGVQALVRLLGDALS